MWNVNMVNELRIRLCEMLHILEALNYFCIKHGDQMVFSIGDHHKCLSSLFPLHLKNLCHRSTALINIFMITNKSYLYTIKLTRLKLAFTVM